MGFLITSYCDAMRTYEHPLPPPPSLQFTHRYRLIVSALWSNMPHRLSKTLNPSNLMLVLIVAHLKAEWVQ